VHCADEKLENKNDDRKIQKISVECFMIRNKFIYYLTLLVFKDKINIYTYNIGGVYMKKRINLSFEEETYVKFRFFCKKKGYTISNKVEEMMQQEMDKEAVKHYKPIVDMFKEMVSKNDVSLANAGQLNINDENNQTDQRNILAVNHKMNVSEQVNNSQRSKVPSLSELKYRRGI
jgi:hypothetical protein